MKIETLYIIVQRGGPDPYYWTGEEWQGAYTRAKRYKSRDDLPSSIIGWWGYVREKLQADKKNYGHGGSTPYVKEIYERKQGTK